MSFPEESKCYQCIIKQLGYFKSLDSESLKHMASCKEYFAIKKGQFLFEEGHHLNGVYCIKSGICKLTKLSSNGKNQIVKFMKKGDLLGRRSIISDDAANLSAIAIENMEVCYIPKTEIISIFNKNSNFSSEIIKDICSDLNWANNQIVQMAQKPVKSRFAFTLINLENEFGTDNNGFLTVKLSREEYANIVGTATESMIRIISGFSKDGLIVTKGKDIRITDKKKLELLSKNH